MNQYERATVALEVIGFAGDQGYHAYINYHPAFVDRNPGGFAVIPDVDTSQTEPPFQVCPDRLVGLTMHLSDEDFIRFCGAVRRFQRATIIDVALLLPPDLVFAKFEQERPDDAAILRRVAGRTPFPVERFVGLEGRSNHGVVTLSARQVLITDRLYKFCDEDPRVYGVPVSRSVWPVVRPRIQDALGWAAPRKVEASGPMEFLFCPELIDVTTEWLGGEGDLIGDYLNVIEVFLSGYLCKPDEDPEEVQRSIESYLYEEAPDHLRLLSEVESALIDAQQH